jgi:peptidoglycan/LPS O-acetylase OafA/YrhL
VFKRDQSTLHGRYHHAAQGLRGVAVLAVLLYHARPSILPFGYLGVDVFCVISGYSVAMSAMKERRLTGQFKPLQFLVRRARRLLPTLLFVLAVTLPACAIFLPVSEVRSNAWTALAASGVSANFKLLIDHGDYFGVTKTPYLHLWSLSMEEQFYIVFAIAFWLLTHHLNRHSRQSRSTRIVLVGLAISLAVPFILKAALSGWTAIDDFLFFSPVSRSWQFMFGMLIAHSHLDSSARVLEMNRQQRQLLAGGTLLGLLALLVLETPLLTNSDSQFFSMRRLLSVLLASGFLWTAIESLEIKPLANGVLRWVGDRSYSIYLWHAPLFFFASEISKSLTSELLALVATITFSKLTYTWFERPYLSRNDGVSPVRNRIGVPAALTLATAATLLFTQLLPNVIQGILESPVSAAEFEDRWLDFAGDTNFQGCLREGGVYRCGEIEDSTQVALVGDSHAMSISHAFLDAARESGVNAVVYTAVGCNFFAALSDCPGVSQAIDDMKKRKLRVFVLACPRLNGCVPAVNATLEDVNSMIQHRRDTLLSISQGEATITLIETLPFVEDVSTYRISVYNALVGRSMANNVAIDHRYTPYLTRVTESDLETVLLADGRLNLLSFNSELCGQNFCIGVDSGGKPVWTNEDHLTIAGSQFLIGRLKNIFRQL